MKMNTTRRSFLLGGSALAMGAVAQAVPNVRSSASTGKPNLRFGVLSDIHITDWASAEILRKAFRDFRDRDVDAVMIAGDMADHGMVAQLENVAKSWFSVFPDDKGLNGKSVTRLFVYGNHDYEGLGYRDEAMNKAFSAMQTTYEEAEKATICRVGLARAWEQCFHEPYAPIYTKRVNGYDFIGGHWDPANGSGWDSGPAIGEWMRQHGASIDTSKPFFYFQHPHPRGTVFGCDTWGEDGGDSTCTFANYPFATVFSGHAHRPITDGRNYWREEFTSIGTGTLSYLCMPGGREGVKNYRTNLDGRCGQIVDVFDDRLVIERRDYYNDEELDDKVVLPLPVKTSSFTVRSLQKSARPAFAPSARVDVTLMARKAVAFDFPGAFDNPTARPFDYLVTVETRLSEKATAPRWSVCKTWAQPEAVHSRRRAQAAGNVRGQIELSGMPSEVVALRVHARARNSYGVAADEIISEWTNVAAEETPA